MFLIRQPTQGAPSVLSHRGLHYEELSALNREDYSTKYSAKKDKDCYIQPRALCMLQQVW